MRIPESDLNIVRVVFKKHFEKADHLWLFGSRVDEKKRGGDLDFYVETHENAKMALNRKMAFVNDLWRFLGEQKIDVVLNLLSSPTPLPIYKIAKQSGVQIV